MCKSRLTCANAGFCGRMTKTELYRNESMKDALVTKTTTKLSSMVGTDFRIQTIQVFITDNTVKSKEPIMTIPSLITCIGVQINSGKGPFQTLIRSTKLMNTQLKLTTKYSIEIN